MRGRFPATARRDHYAVIAPGRLPTEQSSVGEYYGVMASAAHSRHYLARGR